MSDNQPYRFGIFCSGYTFARWQATAIEALIHDGHIPVVLVMDVSPEVERSFSDKVARYTGRNGLYNLFERLRMKVSQKDPVDLQDLLRDAEVIEAMSIKKGYSEYFHEETVDKIRGCRPDFMLRFGFNIIRGEILDVPRYGVWSYHHDDEMKYRGGPPAFWEIYHNDPVTGVILQRLTNRLDGGIILKKGYFKTTNHSYSGNLDRVLERAALWPAQVCRQMAGGIFQFPSESTETNAAIFRRPNNRQMVLFLLRKHKNRILFHWQELFQAEQWRLLVLKKRKSNSRIDFFDFVPIKFPEPPKNHFYADPFLIADDKYVHILYEDYNYRIEKGVLGYHRYNIGIEEFDNKGVALELETHLAYPYLFENEGHVYCLPESASSGSVILYELDREGGKLACASVLIPDFPGVDPSIIYFRGRWWLFCTHRDASNEDLYIFYSDNLFGPYTPHNQNPVKTDINSARPAGNMYITDEVLFRPVQRNAGRYGAEMAIMRVDELSAEAFQETNFQQLSPNRNKKLKHGLHTFSQSNGYAIIDGKTYGFNRYYFFHHLKNKLNK